ncbi:restriction endonuclease subunit S, partial [Candidatus Phytoplasma citri]
NLKVGIFFNGSLIAYNIQVHKKLKVIGKQGVISEIDKNVFYQLTFKLPALKEQKQINVFFNNLSKLLNDIENISIEIRQLQKEKQEYYYLL